MAHNVCTCYRKLHISINFLFQIQALKTVGCGHMAKLYLEWAPTAWWAPGEGGLTLAWTNEEIQSRTLPRDWFMYAANFSEVDGQPNLLCCWIAGSGAKVVDVIGDEEVALGLCLDKF